MQFAALTSRVVVLDRDDVDTDQIIPARFLKTTDKAGLGASLFADWRAPDAPGAREFPLDRDDARGCEVLVAGRNFGCGSSREHAPWALAGAGFRAIVARSFADIFRANALKNGLLPVELDEPSHAALIAARARDPSVTVTIDLAAQTIALPGGATRAFAVDAFARRCLLDGVDELQYLLSQLQRIEDHERRQG